MLYLTNKQLEELIEHSRKEYPYEACGILAGENQRVQHIYSMKNVDKSSQTFFMDPREQIQTMKDIRNKGWQMVGIYHSHPKSKAYPSAHDVELAFYPEASYLIVSLQDDKKPQLRSFKIVEGKISEEEIRIE